MTLTVDILTAFGPGDEPRAHTPLWAVFDPDWYRARYRDAVIEMAGSLPDDRGLYEFWLHNGARYAHSPNRYFDEIWYRRAHFDVENGIRMGVFDSGFQHYCETGHRGRSCHWLFSESDYFSLNPDLTPSMVRDMGFANGFDHYLNLGQTERRVSSAFFSPDIMRRELQQRRLGGDLAEGEFTRFILSRDIGTIRTSWYFDPVWYLETYQDAVAQIERGEYASALHHYLSNDNPTGYLPHPYFDEAYYLGRYDDVAGQIANRVLRNGYEHFVRFGLFEGRSPAPGVELPPYALAGGPPDWQSISSNAFIDHIRREGEEAETLTIAPPSLGQLAHLQALRAETLLPLLARSPLDFRYIGQPELSVIVTAPAIFPDLLQTLVSLHESGVGDMQVIVLDDAGRDNPMPIERYSYGVEVVPQLEGGLQQGWLRAVAQVAAPRVLMIEAGACLFLGALSDAVHALAEQDVIAVAPQALGFDLRVMEAGLTVARDGACFPAGAGVAAFSESVNFARACDGVSGGAILCRTDTLRLVPVPAHGVETLRARQHIWAALSLALRKTQRGARLLYVPGFVLRVPDREPVSEALLRQEMPVLRQSFSDLLRGNPPHRPSDAAAIHRPVRWGRRVLVLGRKPDAAARGEEIDRVMALGRYFVEQGMQASFFLLDGGQEGESRPGADPLRTLLPELCEYRCGTKAALETLIGQRRRGFDVIWIMGGNTLNVVFPILHDHAASLPDEGFILDLRRIEALQRRQDAHTPTINQPPVDEKTFDDALAAEIANAWFCQDLVVQNAAQAEILEKAGLNGLRILGDDLPVNQGAPYEQRHDLVFAAGPATQSGYSLKFLKWFVRDVMSRVNARMPQRVRLFLACDDTRSRELSMITHHQNVASLVEGQVGLANLSATCRLMIAPDERPGCVSLARQQAGGAGLPVIIGGEHGFPGARAVTLDPGQFAEAIISLYQDQETWQRLSDEAMQQARAMSQTYRETLVGLLGQSMVKEEMRD